ncbi:MAG: hypothetical protein U0176_07575 [Bacteroidia bacterium]
MATRHCQHHTDPGFAAERRRERAKRELPRRPQRLHHRQRCRRLRPYTYRWNNGSTAQTLTGLNPGTYSVTVTDGYRHSYCNGTVTQPTRVVADAGPHKVVYPAYAPQGCATLTGTVTGRACLQHGAGPPAPARSWPTATATPPARP